MPTLKFKVRKDAAKKIIIRKHEINRLNLEQIKPGNLENDSEFERENSNMASIRNDELLKKSDYLIQKRFNFTVSPLRLSY